MDFPLPHPGPWLSSQLVEKFGTNRAPERLVAAGFLIRIGRGMYFRADTWAELSADERHLALLAAHHEFHARLRGVAFAYSHLSAARLLGLDLWDPDSLIHLTRSGSLRRSAHRDEVLVHADQLDVADLCEICSARPSCGPG